MKNIEKLNALFERFKDLTVGSFHSSLWQILINGDENGWDERKGSSAFIKVQYPSKGRTNVAIVHRMETGYTPVLFGLKESVTNEEEEVFFKVINEEIFGVTPDFAEEMEFYSYRPNK